MKKFALAATMLLAMLVWNATAATFTGRVSDGDTVTVTTAENRQFKIRLSGTDAPENNRPFGALAKETRGRLLFDRPAIVE